MKRLKALVLGVLLIGCDGTSDPAAPHPGPSNPVTPTTPPQPEPINPVNPPAPSPSANNSIAGFVIDASESCIVGARVEVIDGPLAGASFVQTKCGFWDYGADIGYAFNGLPGKPVTLRATAEGYKTAEVVGTPTNPYSYTTYIILTKTQ